MHSRETALSTGDVGHEALVADITNAVYQLVLNSGAASWIDLQLALWRIVRERLARWEVVDEDLAASFENIGSFIDMRTRDRRSHPSLRR